MNCARRDVAARVPAHPPLQQPEEVVVADLEPQRVQRHRAAAVDGDVEQVVRPGIADRQRPERVVGRDERGEVVEDLLRGPEPLALAPQPLGVGREALVEPDVLPGGERQAVAGPLVRELVDDDRVAVLRAVEEVRRVDRPRLGLEREAEALDVVDDAAGGRERVAPEDAREEREDLGLAGERARGDLAGRRRARPRRCRRSSRSRCPGCPPAGRARSSRRACRRRPRTRSSPAPLETATSSTKTPVPWTTSSLA